MKKLKLTLTRSEFKALADASKQLLSRYPLSRLKQNAADFALVTLWAEVGLKARNKAELLEWAGSESGRLSLLQSEALSFLSLYETNDFGDWPDASFEAAFLMRLAGIVHQFYDLQPPY